MRPIDERDELTRDTLLHELRPGYRPVVIRGAVKDWALIDAARKSPEEAASYLCALDNGRRTEAMLAAPGEKGRFFYRPDMQGFNFQKQQATLGEVAQRLLQIAGDPDPVAIYAGATATDTHLPRFRAENPMPSMDGQADAAARIWLGNATKVATHFDMSDNVAVVASGTRRFTLFPPDATPDLYVGPLNLTPAGQPVSMVDPDAPDLARYPRYANAAACGMTAELEPGDAIYIPALWWHHVSADGPFNVLVNYWHNDVEAGGAFLALTHAMMAVRDLPQQQKKAWQVWFDHFVFDDEAVRAADHLPPNGRGINGPASPQRTQMMRRFIAQVLNARG